MTNPRPSAPSKRRTLPPAPRPASPMSSQPPSTRGKRKRASRVSHPAPPSADCRGAKYHCNYCNKDISNAVRIKCAVCPDFDLCVECFSVGVQVTPHRNNHDYRVVDDLSFPLFHPAWGADEELLLLEAIDMYGLGNWNAVAEHVGTKGDRECESHYYDVYIEPATFPLPSPTPAMAGVDAMAFLQECREGEEGNGVGVEGEGGSGDAVGEEGGEGEASEHSAGVAGSKMSGVEPICGEQNVSSSAGGAEGGGEGCGGVDDGPSPPPKKSRGEEGVGEKRRKEEVKEEEGEGEGGGQQIGGRRLHNKGGRGPRGAGSVVGDEEGGGAVLDQKEPFVNSAEFTGYNPKRDEFDPDYDNDAELLVADLDFPVGEPEEIVVQKMKLLEVYNRRLQIREERKDFIIKRKLLNVKKQQAQERRRSPEMNDLHAALRVLARFHSQEEHEALVEGLHVEKKLRMRIEELKEYRRNGYRTFAEADLFEQERQRRQERKGEKRDKFGRFLTGSYMSPRPAQPGGGKATALALQSWRNKRGVALDITPFPSIDLLTSKERELCANSRLVPAHYLALKDRLLREADKLGYFPRQDVKFFFRLEQSKALRVYDLMHSAGWVKSSPSERTTKGTPAEHLPIGEEQQQT